MGILKAGTPSNGQAVELYYEDIGSGKPVVLIHGWPVSQAMWEYQIAALSSQGCRVVSYDRRGFGRSSKPWDGYDYDTFSDDLKTLLDHLGLQDITLVGFSMGGGEVARYFGRHGGERVSKAILVGAVTPYMLKTNDNPDGIDASVFDEITENLKKDRPAFLQEFGKNFVGAGALHHPVSQAMLDWLQFLALPASPKATLDCVKAFSATDFRSDLESINVPTLIIHGRDDKIVPIEKSARRAAKMIAGAMLREYEGAPHGLFLTHKDELSNDILDFVGR